ncbi:MAG: hypothetical protein WCY08_10075 [Rhodocyclaceae bacterium]
MHDAGQHAEDALEHWLGAGLAWLARLQATGLACAARSLLDEGARWRAHGELLGWTEVVQLADVVLDPAASPATRARAVLDLSAWLATASSLNDARQLLG